MAFLVGNERNGVDAASAAVYGFLQTVYKRDRFFDRTDSDLMYWRETTSPFHHFFTIETADGVYPF